MNVETALLGTFRRLLGNRDLGNGTPLADAAALAIATDARIAGVGMPEVMALPDNVLTSAADDLHRRVNRLLVQDSILPFGAVITGNNVLAIGREYFVIDAGRPGLHLSHTTRKDAHGPNLDLLRRLIEKRTLGKPYRVLGLPSPSSVEEIDVAHYLDFPPCAEAGGVVLRHQNDKFRDDILCALMPVQVEKLADHFTNAMASFWVMRHQIGNRAQAVRCKIESLLQAKYGSAGPVSLRLIAYDWADDQGNHTATPFFQIEFNALDSALRPGNVVQGIAGTRDLECPTFKLDDEWEPRAKRKTELLAKGAVGEIDELAVAILNAAPEGRTAVLSRLSEELYVPVALPCGEASLCASLLWVDGRVCGRFWGDLIRSAGQGFGFRATLPHSIRATAVGQPMSSIVELPFVFDGIIETIEETSQGWLYFTFAEKRLLIDAQSGALRP